MTSASIDVADLPALITKKQVAKWADVSDRHIDKMVRAGVFPKPTYIGVRTPRWRRSDLITWLNAQSETQTDGDDC